MSDVVIKAAGLGKRNIPYDDAYEPGFEDMRRRVPDVTKVRRLIGWEPRVPLEETLRQVIAYEQAKLA